MAHDVHVLHPPSARALTPGDLSFSSGLTSLPLGQAFLISTGGIPACRPSRHKGRSDLELPLKKCKSLPLIPPRIFSLTQKGSLPHPQPVFPADSHLLKPYERGTLGFFYFIPRATKNRGLSPEQVLDSGRRPSPLSQELQTRVWVDACHPAGRDHA